MDNGATRQPDYDAIVRSWGRRVPWYRRVSGRIGLQGKLVVCFVAILILTLGASCWMFLSQSSARLNDVMGEQARQISYSLALASKPALAAADRVELDHIGQDLLKSHNIVFVAFFDGDGKPLSAASRDPDFASDAFLRTTRATQDLMQVRTAESPVFGPYLEVIAPVVSMVREAGRPLGATRLMGYVAVGMSQAREQEQLRRINYLVLTIGAIMTLASIPLAYILVHRIFFPIRQLVAATNRIASGDLEAQVAIDRPDVIGTLARSFNEMVLRVRQQQDQLADANDKLADANRDLERRILLRTEQLEASNKRLKSEIAEKEDFLRAVSHDLNAPLRNISGMATMLLMKHRAKFDEDIIHRLERIQKNVEVETGLISELLELSRIKTRRQKMDAVDMTSLVRELGGVFEEDLETRRIALVIDGELPVIRCERARLRQVFQNLVDNAIKYMGDGPTREIHVGCDVRGDEAEFYVRDTGIGIDPEDLDKVFFVFRRGKNTQSQNVAGKGIGLASVKSIIETYEGTIWVESAPGEGSTFRFTINGRYFPGSGDESDAETNQHEAEPALG